MSTPRGVRRFIRSQRLETSRGPGNRRELVAEWFDIPPSELTGLSEPTIDVMAARLQQQPLLQAEIIGLRAMAARWEHVARIDSLTGLYNRRYVEERLDAEIRRAWRTNRHLALMLVDLDGLKQINDREGHSAGDAVIRAVAGRLQHGVRSTDVVGRWGGDEFIVICPETGDEAANRVAEKLVSAVAQTPIALSPDTTIAVEISIGWAVLGPGDDPASLVAEADQALYSSKGEARARPRAAGGAEEGPGEAAFGA